MPERSYTSDSGADESVSTKGVTFTLDGVRFECDGVFDPNDMMDLAQDLQGASGSWIDPKALGTVGYLLSVIMGDTTFQAFRRHRRQHRTRPEVVAQIMAGLMEDLAGLPTSKPSTSPGGRQGTGSSSKAASPSPGTPRRQGRQPRAVRTLPENIPGGEILTVPAPGPARGEDPPVHRTVSLAAGTVTVEDLAG